jgi:hypothetical protein
MFEKMHKVHVDLSDDVDTLNEFTVYVRSMHGLIQAMFSHTFAPSVEPDFGESHDFWPLQIGIEYRDGVAYEFGEKMKPEMR